MADDEKGVQPETVPEGTELLEGEKPPEPSPEEKLAELVKAQVAEEVAKLTEASKREIQSAKDKAKAEVEGAQRRARLAEGTLGATKKSLQDLDPDVAKDYELAELKAREQGRMSLEQEEGLRRQQEEFHQQFHAGLTQYVKGLGIDPDDPQIDWAGDAPNYLEAQRRVLESVSKIQKTKEDGYEKRLNALEKKAEAENVEANSVSTAASAGVAVGSDAEFKKKWGSGELPNTKENMARARKIEQESK